MTKNEDGLIRPSAMLDEIGDLIRIVDLALHTSPVALAEVRLRQPGCYLLLHVGDVDCLRRARRPDGRSATGPLASAGGHPIYIGSAQELASRARRHVRNLIGVEDLPASDLQAVLLPTATYAGACYAEQHLLDLMRPALNTSWLSGMGSRAQGRNRTGQRTTAFSTLFPGRNHGCQAPAKATREELSLRVLEHLNRTVPDMCTISCEPAAPARSLRLVTGAAYRPGSADRAGTGSDPVRDRSDRLDLV